MTPSPLGAEKPARSSRKSKTPREISHLSYGSTTPSLLNGSGEGKSVSSVRISDGLISVSSPPHSRSSSAQDSYSTSATTFDEAPDGSAPKQDGTSANMGGSEKRSSKADGKGNVVVSVRVRPDAHAGQSNPEGEWMVDGRKSLIAYKGREGGDYFYGKQSMRPQAQSSFRGFVGKPSIY